MSYTDAELFMVDNSTFLTDTTQCGYCLEVHSIMVNLMMGECAPFAVTYWQCVQDLWAHFKLSLHVYYGELGGGAYHVRLCILYWMMQQFLYYLSEHKFGRDPPLLDFAGLLRHIHTKTLDGFLGCLPASWLKKVRPDAQTQTNQGALVQMSPDPHPACNCRSLEPVMNTNYVNSVKKRWLASGLLSNLQAMLQAHSGDGAPLVPKMGDPEACLSWIIKGRCFANCPRVATHKQANQVLVAQVHTLMDACGVPTSN